MEEHIDKNYKLGLVDKPWMSGSAYDVTFIVTQDCNLRCKYCYEVDKNNKNVMKFEIAQKAIDYLLDNPNIFNTEAVVFNFIGGEPLLEIDLIDKIADYIKIETYKKNRKWFSKYRFNISTNGILYDNEKVQNFIKKNKDKLSIGFSIDGNKEKHDLQRIYKDGRGSYDDVVKNVPLWLKQFGNTAHTKVTIGSEDLKYIKDSIIHLWNLGISNVAANVVFEDVWKPNDDVIFEEQLKELADYIIDNKLWNDYNTSLFSDNLGYPCNIEDLNESSCGAGLMLAIDAQGDFYPCLRYTRFSLKNNPSYKIGDINSGIDFDKIRPFLGLNAASISNEECLNCEVATGCRWCQGNNYDSSNSCTNYNRDVSICKMHKARCRANDYYWNKLREVFSIKKKKLNSRDKYLYFIMDDNCVEHCNYNSFEKSQKMNDDILKKGLKFAEHNFYTPIILQSKNTNNLVNINNYSYINRVEIYDNKTNYANNNCKKIQVIDKSSIENEIKSDNCILNINQDNLEELYTIVKKILSKSNRINLNLKIHSKKFDYNLYKDQLDKISSLLLDYYKKDEFKEFDKLTDILFLDSMDNCDCGSNNFCLAPNGKIYICPAFYFNDKDSFVGDLENGLSFDNSLLKLNKAPICKDCDSFHCNRCIYLNKKYTLEYNTPSLLQCKIPLIEKSVSSNLLKQLIEFNPDMKNIVNMKCLEMNDSLEKLVLKKQGYIPYNKIVFSHMNEGEVL